MTDETEDLRRHMLETGQPQLDLQQATERWDHTTVGEHFQITSFMAPFCVAIRRTTGRKGTLEFTHHPRWYFNWQED
jgi:hypothetical protein